MPIIPHRSNYSILDEQRGQTSPFLSLISNSIYIYIYNRPCKLKNLRTRKSNAYCITFSNETFHSSFHLYSHTFSIFILEYHFLLHPSFCLSWIYCLVPSLPVHTPGSGKTLPTVSRSSDRCSLFGKFFNGPLFAFSSTELKLSKQASKLGRSVIDSISRFASKC